MRTCGGKPWGNHRVTQVHYLLRKGEDKRRVADHNFKGSKKETLIEKATLNVDIVRIRDTSRRIIGLESKMEKKVVRIKVIIMR